MLFERNPIPLWIYNSETRLIQDANNAAIRQYGYSRDEFLNMTVEDLFLERDIKEVRKLLNQNKHKINDIGLWQHQTKDNDLIYVEVFDQILDDYEAVRLLLAHNVTNHLQLERKLEAAYHQLNFHVTNSPLAVIEWDHNFRVRKWSKKAEDIFGWSYEEVKNKRPDDFNFIYSEDEEFVRPFINKLSNGSVKSSRMKNRNLAKNGDIKTCEWYNSVLFNNEEKMISILSQVQDVTQKEKYEDLILEQKRILQLIASNSELEDILNQVIYLVQGNSQNTYGTIMTRDGDHLSLAAAPELPEKFCETIDKISLSPDFNGIFSKAVYQKMESVVANLKDDTFFQSRRKTISLAGKHDLQACRSIPIISSQNEVLGVFTFFYSDPATIDNGSNDDVLQIATDLAGIAIERCRAQNILAESEAKFKTIFEYANDGIFILDEYKVVDCNRRILEMLGCSKADIIGKKPEEISPKHQHDGRLSSNKAREKINLALAGQPQFFSWTNVKKSGELVEVQVSLNRVPIGGKYYLQSIIRDVTKQKRVEQSLQENRQRLEKLLENLPGMVYRCRNDKDWTLDFVSEGCYELTGYSVDELMNEEWRRYASLIVPEDRNEVWEKVQEALKQNRPFELEYRIKSADGEIKWVWEKGSSIYYPEKKDIYLEGFITDITERKKAQEDLRVKEKAIESSNSSIILVDLSGHLTYANPSFLNNWKYGDLSEIEGQRLSRFSDNIPKLFSIFSELKEKRNWIGEIRARKKNGDLFDVRVSASLVSDNGGSPICMMASLIDVTDRKLAETELRKSLKEKEVLLSEIHHRVKNNLAVISGLLELQAYNTEDKDARDILQESQSRIHSIAMIHEKLYRSDTLSRIELKNYIGDLVSTIQDTYGKKNIDIKIHADEIYLNITQAIPCALILNELIVNAFKHAFKDLEKGRILIRMTKAASSIKLSVEDNGIGLPDNFNVKSQNSLGMTLIKTLIRQINAEFNILQEDGTKFTIQFELN